MVNTKNREKRQNKPITQKKYRDNETHCKTTKKK